jgi:hypothetical protein
MGLRTIKNWINTLPPKCRIAVFANTSIDTSVSKTNSLTNALSCCFLINDFPEQRIYWHCVFSILFSLEIHSMSQSQFEESLPMGWDWNAAKCDRYHCNLIDCNGKTVKKNVSYYVALRHVLSVL